MKKPTIAEVAYKYCIDNNFEGIAYGDTFNLGKIAQLSGMKPCHPLDMHERVLKALERRPDLFKKSYYRLRRIARNFDIILKDSSDISNPLLELKESIK